MIQLCPTPPPPKKNPQNNTVSNLDSVLRSRDITLPANVHTVKTMTFPVVMYGCECAKVHIVKIMAFPVVMCGCESWTIKRLSAEELMLLTVVLEKTPESPLGSKEIKPISSK